LLKDFLKRHNEIFSRFPPRLSENIEQAARLIAHSFKNDGKLYICGVGLSACFARYAAALFSRHHADSRPSLPATAIDYLSISLDEDVFSRQISALITDRDILLGISAVLPYDALQKTFKVSGGAKNIALVGSAGGHLNNLCDLLIEADRKNYLDIQEIHLFTLHSICEMAGMLMFDGLVF
jgi:D-sedoheptulose 7-phosphate isomerase